MMAFYGDNIHTIRVKAAIMKAALVALAVFATVSLIIFPTATLFTHGLDDALGVFFTSFMFNLVVAFFSGIFLSDLPEALGKIKAHEEREAREKLREEQEKLREAEAVLRDFDRRRNNY